MIIQLAPPAQNARVVRVVRRALRWIWSSVLGAAFVLWGAATLAFLGMKLMPGDPALAIAGGEEAQPSQETLDHITAEYRLDDPLFFQYLGYLSRLVVGDLGYSYRSGQPVVGAILEQLPATLQLAGIGLLIGTLYAVVAGVLTAGGQGHVPDALRNIELVLTAAPSYWIGILLLWAFSYTLPIFPSLGNRGWMSLVLPALTIAIPVGATLAQLLRSSMESVIREPFILSARSRGMGWTAAKLRHALRHSALPALTVGGYILGGLFGGAVITESLFSRQGVGRLLLRAVNNLDVPLVIGVVLFSSAFFVVLNIIVDGLHLLLDPRLTEQHERGRA